MGRREDIVHQVVDLIDLRCHGCGADFKADERTTFP
jgi:hypothetical protein